jgi:hypothetical protein
VYKIISINCKNKRDTLMLWIASNWESNFRIWQWIWFNSGHILLVGLSGSRCWDQIWGVRCFLLRINACENKGQKWDWTERQLWFKSNKVTVHLVIHSALCVDRIMVLYALTLTQEECELRLNDSIAEADLETNR